MKLADLYARSGLTLSVEFFTPKTEKGEETLFSEIAAIKRLNPGFCSVTYGAGGSTREKTVGLIEIIRERLELEAMCHLTVVSQSKDDARAVLRTPQRKGHREFACARRRSTAGGCRLAASSRRVSLRYRIGSEKRLSSGDFRSRWLVFLKSIRGRSAAMPI